MMGGGQQLIWTIGRVNRRLSVVATLPTTQFQADSEAMREGMIVVRKNLMDFERVHDEWFRGA